MTDYAKVTSKFVYSKNSDYSFPRVDTKTQATALTPDEWEYREIEADIAGSTVDLGHFATVTAICVWNLDTTNYVTVGFGSGSTDNVVTVNAGGQIVMADVAIDEADDLVLTADTAAVECLVAVCGT